MLLVHVCQNVIVNFHPSCFCTMKFPCMRTGALDTIPYSFNKELENMKTAKLKSSFTKVKRIIPEKSLSQSGTDTRNGVRTVKITEI